MTLNQNGCINYFVALVLKRNKDHAESCLMVQDLGKLYHLLELFILLLDIIYVILYSQGSKSSKRSLKRKRRRRPSTPR